MSTGAAPSQALGGIRLKEFCQLAPVPQGRMPKLYPLSFMSFLRSTKAVNSPQNSLGLYTALCYNRLDTGAFLSYACVPMVHPRCG